MLVRDVEYSVISCLFSDCLTMDSIVNRSAEVLLTGCEDCSNEERDPFKSALSEGWDYSIAVYLILLGLY